MILNVVLVILVNQVKLMKMRNVALLLSEIKCIVFIFTLIQLNYTKNYIVCHL